MQARKEMVYVCARWSSASTWTGLKERKDKVACQEGRTMRKRQFLGRMKVHPAHSAKASSSCSTNEPKSGVALDSICWHHLTSPVADREIYTTVSVSRVQVPGQIAETWKWIIQSMINFHTLLMVDDLHFKPLRLLDWASCRREI